MEEILGLKQTGKRLRGPASDLVELDGEGGLRLTAIVFHDEYKAHRSINESFEVVRGFLESPWVTGMVELKNHEDGVFVYPSGECWSLAEVIRVLADMGKTAGIRAGLELMYVVGQILIEAAETGESQGVCSHGGLTPWRIVLRRDGQAQVIGYALPQVEILMFHEDGKRIPREDSFRYCPPERIEQAPEDLHSDLFSLGLIAFELMTGRPVYDGLVNDIRQQAARGEGTRRLYRFREQIPEAVRECLGIALRRDTEDRYGSGQDFLDAVSDALARSSVSGGSLMDVMEDVTRVGRRSATQPDSASTMMAEVDQVRAMLRESEDVAEGSEPRWTPAPDRKERGPRVVRSKRRLEESLEQFDAFRSNISKVEDTDPGIHAKPSSDPVSPEPKPTPEDTSKEAVEPAVSRVSKGRSRTPRTVARRPRRTQEPGVSGLATSTVSLATGNGKAKERRLVDEILGKAPQEAVDTKNPKEDASESQRFQKGRVTRRKKDSLVAETPVPTKAKANGTEEESPASDGLSTEALSRDELRERIERAESMEASRVVDEGDGDKTQVIQRRHRGKNEPAPMKLRPGVLRVRFETDGAIREKVIGDDQSVAEVVCDWMNTELVLPFDLTGRLKAWPRLRQGKKIFFGCDEISDLEPAQIVDLEWIPNREKMIALFVGEGKTAQRMLVSMSTAVPVVNLLVHLCEWLGLNEEQQELVHGDRVLGSGEILADLPIGEERIELRIRRVEES